MDWEAFFVSALAFLGELWPTIGPLLTGAAGAIMTAIFTSRREVRNLQAAHASELERIAQQHALDESTRSHDRARAYADDARLACADQLDWLRTEWLEFDVKYTGEEEHREFVQSVRVSEITGNNVTKVRQLGELLPHPQTRTDVYTLMSAHLRLDELQPKSVWHDSSPFVTSIRIFELASAVLAAWLRNDPLEPEFRSQVDDWQRLLDESRLRFSPASTTPTGDSHPETLAGSDG